MPANVYEPQIPKADVSAYQYENPNDRAQAAETLSMIGTKQAIAKEQIASSVMDRARQSALAIESIQNAKANRENAREELALKKKRADVDIDLAIRQGKLDEDTAEAMRQQMKDQHSQVTEQLDAHETLSKAEKQKHIQNIQQSAAFLQSLMPSQIMLDPSTDDMSLKSRAQAFYAGAENPNPPQSQPSIPMTGGVPNQPVVPKRYEFDLTKSTPRKPVYQETDAYQQYAKEGGKAVPISEDEIESKAQALIEGRMAPSQLPKFGGAASIFNKVTARAFEKDPSFSLTAAEQDFASKKSALNQMLKTSSLIKSFEATAYKNANVLEMLTDKVDWRGKSPLLNNLKQSWNMRVVQDPATATAKTALVTFTTEYAKIMSGQTGGAAVSDSARKEASDLIALTDNPEAFANRIEVMKQDMKNRRDGLDEEIGSLRGKPLKATRGTEELESSAFVKKAKAAGYSDEEIQDYLNKRK